MSSNGLWAALLEIVHVSSQCRNFWQDGLDFSRNSGKIVAEISNPETSVIGRSRSRLVHQLEYLEVHCEESLNQAKTALGSAQRSLSSVGEGELADSDDLAYLESWRDVIVRERSEDRLDQGVESTPQGFLGQNLRERGQELFTTAEFENIRKTDFLRTRSEAVAIWIGMVEDSEPIFEILSEICVSLLDLLRIIDDQRAWRLAIGAMEARLGGNDAQILCLESEIQALRREKVIEWGG